MPTNVDQLITEYVAIDKATIIINQVAKSNEELDKKTKQVNHTLQNIERGFKVDRILHGLDRVKASLQTLRDYGATAFQWVGKASSAASEYASLQARLEALTNSYERTQRILKTAELVAAPSPLTTRQLADAAVTLEAYGANADRILPSLGRLSAAMGAGDEQIQMFTRAFGELSTGKMIEADVLASMGLSKKDFAAQGIQFDGQGSLKSSAIETMDALEKIINQRFGNILDKMADTPEAKRASLEDAGEKVMRIIGGGFLKAAAPFMESATKVLTGLATSGVLDEVTQKITGAFLGAFGADKTEALARIAANVLAFLYDLPDRIAAVYNYITGLFSAVAFNVGASFDYIERRWAALINGVTEGASYIATLIQKGFEAVKPFVLAYMKEQFAQYEAMITSLQSSLGDNKKFVFGEEVKAPDYKELPSFSGLLEQMGGSGKSDEFFNRIMQGANAPTGGLPDNSNQPWLTRQGQEAQDVLGKIADNTDRSARNLERMDVSRLLFGGGDRAAAGVSILDIFPRRQSPSPRTQGKIEVKVGGAATAMERAILEILRETLPQIQRSLTGFSGVQG